VEHGCNKNVVKIRRGKRTPLADALFRAAMKIVRRNGDPAQAAAEVIKVYRKMSSGLKDAMGLMHFLEEVSDGIRATNEHGRQMKARKLRLAAVTTIN